MSTKALQDRIIYKGALISAFLIPLKLSLVYIISLPTLLYWIYLRRSKFRKTISEYPTILITPLILWVLASFLSAPFGIHPLGSITHLTRLCLGLINIWFFFEICKTYGVNKLLIALLSGQAIAAIHTVIAPLITPLITPLIDPNLNQIFLGAVTESGQLALTLILACGFSFYIFFSEPEPEIPGHLSIFSILNLSLFCFLSFFGPTLSIIPLIILAILIIISLSFTVRYIYREYIHSKTYFAYLLCVVAPLLGAALIINLKRGPWFGVCIAGLLFLAKYYKKLVFPAFLAVLLAVITIAPVKDRLVESYDDFFIAGGRNIMWQIGAELSAKYPLGIGYRNSKILQKFDPTIPPMHTHFHNNLLNILVETGWLGLLLFLWWIFGLVRVGFKNELPFPQSFLLFTLTLSLISWQTAGLVEYNFGDSEVVFIVYILLGAMGALLVTNSTKQEAG